MTGNAQACCYESARGIDMAVLSLFLVLFLLFFLMVGAAGMAYCSSMALTPSSMSVHQCLPFAHTDEWMNE